MENSRIVQKKLRKKIILTMKFFVLFTLLGVVNAFSASYAQNTKLNIKVQNGTFYDVVSQIEEQSEFMFFYKSNEVDNMKKVSINAKNQTVFDVLDLLLKGSDLTYSVSEKHIFFKKKGEETGIQQQTRLVTGVIRDELGEPVMGASVTDVNSKNGVVSDSNGKFSIAVSGNNPVLKISYLGYIEQMIEVGSLNSVDIVMKENTHLLDEVVVVGYGTSKSRDIIGSMSKITSEDISKTPTASLANALQGMSSGLMVSNTSAHPGSAPQIKVRGLNSINLSTDPLWIVDGVPIQTAALEQAVGGVKSVSPISMLNPNDIETIQVLKDAAATAIYGNRGSGGVIIVTTKANKGKLTNFSVNYDGGVSKMPFSQNDIFVDSRTYWDLTDKAWANSGNKSLLQPEQIISTQFIGIKPVMTREDALATNTDHLGAMTQDAWFHQVGITANKGFETGGVMFSLNYRDEEGLIRNNDFERLTMRFNFNFKPVEKVEMGVNTNFIYLKTNGVKSGLNKGEGGWSNWASTLPWYKIYDENDQHGYWAINSGYNPLAFSDRDLIRNDVDQYRTLSNGYLQWITPLKDLKLRGEVGVDLIVNNSSHWQSTFLATQAPFASEASEKSITRSIGNYDAYANYSKTFGLHFLDVTAGWEASRDWSYTRYASGQQLQTGYPELINPLMMNSMSGSQGGGQYLMGFFGRLNYKFMDKYLINTSLRRDGHSALSKENRWADFSSGGVGWIISDEAFMQGIKPLNLLKLRASYGKTGNAAINSSMTYMSWKLDASNIFGVNYLPASTTVGPLGSSDLKWETTANMDLGFDYGLFNNRINGSFAYYKQKISDLILSGNVAPSVGYTTNQIYENVGDMENWGFEFNISSVNIDTKNFRWKTDFNISSNKNKVVRLNEFEKGKGNEGSNSIRKEGEALNTWYLANYVNVDPEKGINMMEQRDADIWNKEFRTVSTGTLLPMTTNNMNANKMIQHGKTPLPTYYGGFNNNFYYKNFDLNIMFAFAGGHWLMNETYNRGATISGVFNNVKDLVGKTWEKPGDVAEYPQLVWNSVYSYDNNGNATPGKTTAFSTSYTTRFLERGDYIRLRNLQLGYTFPKSVLSHIKLSNLRLYVGATNLFTITGFNGYDPETQTDLPIPRTFNFGLSLNL